MAHEEPQRTTEGTSWPIVLFVELTGDRAKAWSRAVEEANIIVLAEASILRAALVVRSEKPHVVVLSAALPPERTQVVMDAVTEVGAELLPLKPDATPAEVRALVEKSVAAAQASKGR